MDIPAEFYLQTVETVFQKQSLPRGTMKWRNPLTDKLVDVRPQDIRHTALLTIEGELDDISARGQTTAAHELCYSLPQKKQYHHFQLGTGHYGIFSGRRWRDMVYPQVSDFILSHHVSTKPKRRVTSTAK
jgi:poly(3-hydroxybutyrate) depolymerase